MNWKNYFSTSVGKKIIMSLTGLFLIVFLLVHCYVNAQIFWMDGGEKFMEAAHFMGSNPIIRITEIGLFVGLIAHIVQGLSIFFKNRSKRKTRYAVSAGNATSKWYSRSMGLLGTLILLFLILHLYHFWIPNRGAQSFGDGELDLYSMMYEVFQNPIVVMVYVLGCVSLAFHLVHGFYSAFHTLGLAQTKYVKLIKNIGITFAILIPLIFASMPISFFLNWVS